MAFIEPPRDLVSPCDCPATLTLLSLSLLYYVHFRYPLCPISIKLKHFPVPLGCYIETRDPPDSVLEYDHGPKTIRNAIVAGLE